jgi:hypothetical protein
MEKSQYDACIVLGKTVMKTQRIKPDSPQHKAAYAEWDENCGIAVMLPLAEKYHIKGLPVSPLDWTKLK